MTTANEIPVACQLTDAELAARRQRIVTGLVPHIQERRELADGYRFRFPATDAVAHELLAFVLLERQCCPFFEMELSFPVGKSAIWLGLRGGEGAKQFIETELAPILT
ncbi:MAG: hypothetical protein IPM53_24760 [Anaerolineaceae bacterium]|nr:hypothetical protein [Anaerolineaceae bacterium]